MLLELFNLRARLLKKKIKIKNRGNFLILGFQPGSLHLFF